MDKQSKGEPQRESELRSLGRYSPDIRTLKSVKMPTFHFGMLAQAFSLGILGRLSSNPFAAYPGFSMTYFVENGKEETGRPEEGQTSGAVYSPVLNMNFQFILNQLEQEKASWQGEGENTQSRKQDQGADFHREPQRAGETENVRERQENTREFVDYEIRLKRIEEIERVERIIEGAIRMQNALASRENTGESHSLLVQLPQQRAADSLLVQLPQQRAADSLLVQSPQQRAAEQMRRLYEKNMPQTLQRSEYLNELHYLQDGRQEEVVVPGGTEEVHQNILRDVVEGIAAAQVRAMPIATLLYQTETERFHKVDNAQRVEEMRRLYEKNMPQTLRRNEYLNELRYLQDGRNEEIVVPSEREEVHRNLLRDVVESVTTAQIRTMPVQTLLYQTEEEHFHRLDNAQRLKEMRDIYEKNMPQTLRRNEYLSELKYLQDSRNEEIQLPNAIEEVHRNLLRDVVENVTTAQIRSLPLHTILYQTEAQIRSLPLHTILYQTEEERSRSQDFKNREFEVPSSVEEIHRSILRDRVDNVQRIEEMRRIYEKNMPQTLRRDEYLNELKYLQDSGNEEIQLPGTVEEIHQNILRDIVENVTTAQIRSLPLNTILYQTEEERFHKVDNSVQHMEEMRRIYEKNMPQTLRRDEYSNELLYLQDSKGDEIEIPGGTEEIHRNLVRNIIEGVAATQIRSLPLDTILHQTEREQLLGVEDAKRKAEMRQIYEKNMPQALRRDEYISELRYRSGRERTEEIEISSGTEDVYRNIVKEIIEETEHTDLIQKLIRREPRVEDMHEVSVLKRFGAPTPVLLQDETSVEIPVDVVYAKRRDQNKQQEQQVEESADTSPSVPPIQADWDDDVPQWARDFFDQLPPEVQQDPEKAERARIYRKLRERLANRNTSSGFHWEDPEVSRVAGFGDPDFLPPQDLQYKQVRREETQSKQRSVVTHLSESEIQRAADRVYHILEERIREERRRMGL